MKLEAGNQPVIIIRAKTLSSAFVRTLKALWEKGCNIQTSFDRKGDPPGKDATVLVEIEDPFGEPRLHKLGWPGEFKDLETYRLEVVAGVHDHWIERGGQRWNYTYHERLFAYNVGDGKKVNQIENMIRLMVSVPDFFRRRFQVITWIPSIDPFIKDPPCLQRLHFRWLPGEDEYWVLNLNSDWRSRDFLNAWFMNVWAMIDLQRIVAKEVGRRKGIKIKVGRYTDKSDSLHIYGKDFQTVEGMLKRIKKVHHRKLCWRTNKAESFFESARYELAAQLESERLGFGKGVIGGDIDSQSISYPEEWRE